MTTAQDEPAGLLIDFCNTVDVEDGTDELATVESYGAWLAQHDLGQPERSPTSADLAAAVRLRTTLRGCIARACQLDPADPIAGADGEVESPQPVDVPVDVLIAVDGTGVQLSAADPLARIAIAAAELAVNGRFERVKICPADDCRWVFYDRSRNGSRQWCSMQVCGNRAKVRASRERSRAAGGSTS